MLTISKQQHPHHTVFYIDGRVDAEGAAQLHTMLTDIYEAGQYQLVLELSKTDYLNSAGLRTFADMLTKCRERGGDLTLVAPNAKIRRVLEIIGFTMFFKVFDDIAAALEES